jgi:hypothetical protein
MKKSTQTLLTVGLALVAIVLSYWLYSIINKPIEFEKIKSKRYAKVEKRLEEIRDAQQAYRQKYGKYSDDFNQLIAFVDTGMIDIVVRKDSSFMAYNKTYQQDMNRDTVIIRVIGRESAKTSIFKGEYDASQLRVVPIATIDEEFEIGAGSLERNGISIPVFEVSVSNELMFKDIMDTYSNFIDKNYKLQMGSLTEPSVSGNWK